MREVLRHWMAARLSTLDAQQDATRHALLLGALRLPQEEPRFHNRTPEMRVLVVSESDYDSSRIHGVVTSFAAAEALVRSMHKQKSLRLEIDQKSISAIYRGGTVYYEVEAFDVLDDINGERP